MDRPLTFLEFACHSAACAPPPAGTGGSIASKRTTHPALIAEARARTNIERVRNRYLGNAIQQALRKRRVGKLKEEVRATKHAISLKTRTKLINERNAASAIDKTTVTPLGRANRTLRGYRRYTKEQVATARNKSDLIDIRNMIKYRPPASRPI